MAITKKAVKKSRKKIHEKTLKELKQGEVVAYAFANYCGDGLQSIDDDWMSSLAEANSKENYGVRRAENFEAVVEIRIVARRNPTPMVTLGSENVA